MFGPVRGPWPDESWRGWWGEEPPYHVPSFVLTHHARPPLVMKGGTTFHFVTGGINEALDRAREAAGSRDIRIGGGMATIRQYLEARLQVLADRGHATTDADVARSRRFPGAIQGFVDSARDEMKRGAALHDERRTRVMREDERGHVI